MLWRSGILGKGTLFRYPPARVPTEVLAAYPGLRLSSALSCISYAGRQILSKLTSPSYLQALLSDPMGGVLT